MATNKANKRALAIETTLANLTSEMDGEALATYAEALKLTFHTAVKAETDATDAFEAARLAMLDARVLKIRSIAKAKAANLATSQPKLATFFGVSRSSLQAYCEAATANVLGVNVVSDDAPTDADREAVEKFWAAKAKQRNGNARNGRDDKPAKDAKGAKADGGEGEGGGMKVSDVALTAASVLAKADELIRTCELFAQAAKADTVPVMSAADFDKLMGRIALAGKALDGAVAAPAKAAAPAKVA
jgi:hypothetical protein